MNGDYDNFVPVPPSDLHFWYYFNETCFVECDAFQRRKKIEEVERVNKKLFTIEDKNIKPEPEPEKIIEQKSEPEPELIVDKKKEDDMPIEENHDFLKQKQEHPKYDKDEIKKRVEGIKAENTEKIETEKKKKAEDKKSKKAKKGDDQTSLF